jgi:hypothetical protein
VRVVGRAYLVLGGAVLLMGVLYWVTSYENAGTAMLLLAACLALAVGGYLAFTARRTTGSTTGGAEGGADEPYLPHASPWPFFIGVAALVTANGLALGPWALVPGVIALCGALVGYAGQSRRRG